MSSANVLPSAPPEASPIYPQLPLQAENFRLQKINEIANTLDQEVDRYRLVAIKYKRAKKVVNWSAAGCGALSTALSSASLGTALSVVGLPASLPLGGLAGSFSLVSSCLIVGSKNLESKMKKHEEIITLAVAKPDTVTGFCPRL